MAVNFGHFVSVKLPGILRVPSSVGNSIYLKGGGVLKRESKKRKGVPLALVVLPA